MDLPFKAFSLQSLKVHSLVFPSGCGVSALNEAERGNLRPIGYVFENRLPWRYAAVTLGIKTAQKPYIVWSLGPKAFIYESLDS